MGGERDYFRKALLHLWLILHKKKNNENPGGFTIEESLDIAGKSLDNLQTNEYAALHNAYDDICEFLKGKQKHYETAMGFIASAYEMYAGKKAAKESVPKKITVRGKKAGKPALNAKAPTIPETELKDYARTVRIIESERNVGRRLQILYDEYFSAQFTSRGFYKEVMQRLELAVKCGYDPKLIVEKARSYEKKSLVKKIEAIIAGS